MQALNLNQILFMEKMSTANDNHNIRNVIWNAQSLKTSIFVRIEEKSSPGHIWMVDTRVTDIPSFLAYLENLNIYKQESHIGDMSIILSLSILSITYNYRMIQTPNISCGATHQN